MPRSSATVNTTFNATDRMRGPMNRMQRNVAGFSRNAQRSLGGVSRSFDRMRNLARIATGAIATGLVARGIGGLVRAAADVETVTTQFETLTGSVANARDLVGDLQQFAASTPLQFETLAQGTQRLLAFGIAQEDVIGTLNMLGDAATGDANKLDSLTRAFGKVNARGRASMEEINMVIDAGVPIMDALNSEFGTTTEDLSEMIRAGQVTSDVFTNAFRRMTREGGMFYRGMERQSQTTAGLFSTLKDNVQLTAASLGTALLPTVQRVTTQLIDLAGGVREWVANNEELIRQKVEGFIEKVGDAVEFLRRNWDNGMIPAILAGVAAFKILLPMVQGVMIAFSAFKKLQAAGGILSFLATGPVGLIVGAIAALIAITVLLVKNWDTVKDVAISVWQSIVEYLQGVWQFFSDFAAWLGEIFAPVGNAIRDAFVGAFTFIRDYVQAVWEFISPIVDAIMGVVDKVGGFLGGRDGRDAEEGRQANTDRYGLTTANMGAAAMTRTERSETNNTLDINFGNLPAGASARMGGRRNPNIRVDAGLAGAQL
jgi:tape measure domain-containing protein